MKFKAERIEFLKALQSSAKGTNAKVMPVLANTKIKVTDKIELIGYDLKTAVISSSDCRTDEAGEILLNTEKLIKLLEKSSDSLVDFNTDDKRAIIKCGNSKITIPTERVEDFPQIEIVEGETLSIKKDILVDMFKRAMFAVDTSKEPARPELCCVNLTLGENIQIRSCDGFKSAIIGRDTEGNQFNIFANDLNKALSILTSDEIVLTNNKNKMMLSDDNGNKIITSLCNKDFPNITPIFERAENNKQTIKLYAEELNEVMGKMFALCSGTEPVRLVIHKTSIEFIYNDSTTSYTDSIDCRLNGDEFEIGFNVAYLYNLSKNIEGECELLCNDKQGAVVCKCNSDKYLLMPMRLK